MTAFFKQNANVYQFIYSTLFPKYFCRFDNDAMQSRCIFETAFVNFKAQKNGFNLNVINTTIKIESEEKEEEIEKQKNDEKLNQKIKKRNQRKKTLLKILKKTRKKWQK